MRSFYFLFLWGVMCFSTMSFAQITNGGFEDWDANGNPVNWLTNNTPGAFTTITRTSDASAGSWAAQGDVVSFSVFTVGPSLISGEEGFGFPINFRPAAFRGFYKFTSVQSDFMQVQANFMKNGVGMGVAATNLNPAATYTEFSIPTNFITGETPDSVLIAVFIANPGGLPFVGSRYFVDDLSWSGTTDINDDNLFPANFELEQNYPNPFNPGTKISWRSPVSGHQTLKVFDVLGNEVATLVNEYRNAGSYNVDFNGSQIATGIYYYQLRIGDFIETKKMLMLK